LTGSFTTGILLYFFISAFSGKVYASKSTSGISLTSSNNVSYSSKVSANSGDTDSKSSFWMTAVSRIAELIYEIYVMIANGTISNTNMIRLIFVFIDFIFNSLSVGLTTYVYLFNLLYDRKGKYSNEFKRFRKFYSFFVSVKQREYLDIYSGVSEKIMKNRYLYFINKTSIMMI